jgi:hypothetical protein
VVAVRGARDTCVGRVVLKLQHRMQVPGANNVKLIHRLLTARIAQLNARAQPIAERTAVRLRVFFGLLLLLRLFLIASLTFTALLFLFIGCIFFSVFTRSAPAKRTAFLSPLRVCQHSPYRAELGDGDIHTRHFFQPKFGCQSGELFTRE